MNYTVNSVIRNIQNNIDSRILWFDDEVAYVIDIGKNHVPYLMRYEDLEQLLVIEDIYVLDKDPYFVAYKEEDIPEKHIEFRDKKWQIIKDIVIDEPHVFQSSYRRKSIKEISKKYSVSELSIIGYLKRYWEKGKTPNALLPLYNNCGGKGKERESSELKRGRPRENPQIEGEGVNVTEEIKKIFIKSINRFYYTEAKNSLVRTYELMRKEYFNDGYQDVNGVSIPIIKPQSQIPSFGQFRYWFEKERNIKKEVTSRYSNKKYQKQFRAIPGKADSGVLQPGVYEIDTQIADIYLVSRYNRNWIIGRPILVIVIDKFSRIIAGVYVGIENPSYASAMMALYNAITDKVALCNQYGITIEEDEWPVKGLPTQVIADRGELEGYSVSNLINSLNINVSLTPSYRADLKSYVENYYNILNQLIKPHMPGVINLDGRERGDKDYRVSAKLDIYQYTQIVIKAILYYNNYSVLDNYKRNELMISDDVNCIPRDLYNWGIANCSGPLRTISDDILKLSLLPTAEATVTGKGIRFKDLYYASKDMLKDQTLVRARKATWKVKINYDPRDLNYIYMRGEKPSEYKECFLLDASNRYRDKMFEEVENLLITEKLQKASIADTDAQAKIQLITEIEDIVNNAEKDYINVVDTKESDKRRIENIRENRKIERTANRGKEVFRVEKKEDCGEGYIDDVDEDVSLRLLLEKQRKELSNE